MRYISNPIANFSILQEGIDIAGDALENTSSKPIGLLKRKPLTSSTGHGGSNAVINALFDPIEAMMNSKIANSKTHSSTHQPMQ